MTRAGAPGRLQAFWSTAALYLGGAAAIQAINLLAQPIFAYFLTPADWGVAANYLFWMTAFGLLIGVQAQSALNSIRVEHGEAALPAYIRSVVPWYAVPSLVLVVVIGLAPDFWSRSVGLSAGYLMLAVANGVMFAVNAMGMGHAVTLGDRRQFLRLSIASTVVPLLVGFALVGVMLDNALARILGYFIGMGCVVLYQVVRAVPVRAQRDRTLLAFGIGIALPLLAHELIYLVLSQANRVFLSALVDQEAAGIYAFAFTLANVAVIAATAVNSSWTPWYFEQTRLGDDARVRRTGSDLLLGFSVIVSMACLVAPEGLRSLSRESYAGGALVVPVIVACAHLLLVFNLMANYAIYRQRTRLVLLVSAGAAIVSVVLNLSLIPRWTLMGAALASFAATAWLAIGMTWIAGRYLKSPNLPLRAVVISVVLVTCCAASSVLAMHLWVLRFLFAGFLAALLGGALLRRRPAILAARRS